MHDKHPENNAQGSLYHLESHRTVTRFGNPHHVYFCHLLVCWRPHYLSPILNFLKPGFLFFLPFFLLQFVFSMIMHHIQLSIPLYRRHTRISGINMIERWTLTTSESQETAWKCSAQGCLVPGTTSGHLSKAIRQFVRKQLYTRARKRTWRWEGDVLVSMILRIRGIEVRIWAGWRDAGHSLDMTGKREAAGDDPKTGEGQRFDHSSFFEICIACMKLAWGEELGLIWLITLWCYTFFCIGRNRVRAMIRLIRILDECRLSQIDFQYRFIIFLDQHFAVSFCN